LLVEEPDDLVLEMIRKLCQHFKTINIATHQIRKFDNIEKEIYESQGLILNITNHFKKVCAKSQLVFNFDFQEKDFEKLIFLPDAIIVHLKQNMEVKQSNFKGKIIDFYGIDLPVQYKKLYDKLHRFNSSRLYESFIYKHTSVSNILKEIQKDHITMISLEKEDTLVSLDMVDKKIKKKYNVTS